MVGVHNIGVLRIGGQPSKSWMVMVNKISKKLKSLPVSIEGFTPRLGVDEEIIYSFRGKNYRILVFRIKRREK